MILMFQIILATIGLAILFWSFKLFVFNKRTYSNLVKAYDLEAIYKIRHPLKRYFAYQKFKGKI